MDNLTSTTGLDGYSRAALFSPCERYRYGLARSWDDGSRYLTFIMLNPSTADETVNDPTIERLERRARQSGYHALGVINLFAWRATDPRELRSVDDPVGPDNDSVIAWALEAMRDSPESVVCGWGPYGTLHGRDRRVRELLAAHTLTAMALKVTKTGQPQHPLYLILLPCSPAPSTRCSLSD